MKIEDMLMNDARKKFVDRLKQDLQIIFEDCSDDRHLVENLTPMRRFQKTFGYLCAQNGKALTWMALELWILDLQRQAEANRRNKDEAT